MERQLLVEYFPFSISKKVIEESLKENDGKLIVAGLMQSGDKRNQNGRVYPYEVLKRECDKYLKLVQEDRALGELDHPDSPVVNLKNTSHIIRDMWWNGRDLYGRIEVLNTPPGRILRSLFESGIRLGISSRAMGTVIKDEERGADIVGDDLELIAFDFVSNPSTMGAFMLKEGKNLSLSEIAKVSNKDDIRYKHISDIVRDILEVYSEKNYI